MTVKSFFKGVRKVALFLLIILLVLVLTTFIYINTKPGKQFVKFQLQSYLQKKLSVKVSIANLDFSFPKWIALEGIYMEDKQKDTLLYGERVAVEINMLTLIGGNIDIRKIDLKNVYANITRSENDSLFNYQFLIDAFVSKPVNTVAITDTAALKITLKKLLLNNIKLKFTDKFGGSEMITTIEKFEANLNQFQPDKMRFKISDFTADGISFIMNTYKNSINTSSPDTSKFGLFLQANNINLRNVNVLYQNRVDGMFYQNKINHFGISKIDLNLANEKVLLGNVFLNNSFIQYTFPTKITEPISDTIINTNNWNIAVNKINLNNNEIIYNDNNIAASKGFDMAHISLSKVSAGMANFTYHGDSLLAIVNQLTFKDKSGFSIDTTHAIINYTSKGIEVDELYLRTPQSTLQSTIAFRFNNIKSITTSPQNSELTVKVANTSIAVNDLYLLAPFTKTYLPEDQFKNNVIKLTTEINGTLFRLNIPSLQIAALNGTVINAKAILYNVTNPKTLSYDIAVFNSTIPKNDFAKYFASNTALINKLPASFNIATHLVGNLKNTIADISVNSNTLQLAGKFALKNFDKPTALQYNIELAHSYIKKDLLIALIPPESLPASINLPEIIKLTGTAKGDINNVHPNLLLQGSYGTAKINGYVYNFKNPERANYNISFLTKNFQLGKLIKQDSLVGNLSFSGTAVGKGFNYKTMVANIKATIDSIGLKQYDYQNLSLIASFSNGIIASSGNINDPNLLLAYTATANVSGKYPSFESTVRVDTMLLLPLHLYSDTVNASFTAYVKADDLDPSKMNIFALVDSSTIQLNNKVFALDSIVASATNINGINTVYLKSPIADITANGKFEYDKVGSSLLQYIDKYYNITDTIFSAIAPQQFLFEGIIKKDPIIEEFANGLNFASIPFKGSFTSNAADSALRLNVSMPYIQYQGNSVSNGSLEIISLNEKLSAVVNTDTVVFGKNTLYKTAINATVVSNNLQIAALTKDQNNKDRFAIGTSIAHNGDTYSFSLSDTLLLNYKKWAVASDNYVQYSPKGFIVKNIFISNDSSSIAASGRQQILNSPIDVTISNFKISDITSLINSDTLLASGIIDAKFAISEFNKKLPAFTGTIQVDSLQFMQQPLGTIKLFTERVGENTITANMGLSGSGNNVVVKGNYYLNDEARQFDVAMDIDSIKLATLQVFSGGNIVGATGSLNGKLVVDGKFAEPHWNGAFNFDSTRFSLAKFGTSYTINNQKISFDYPVITLSNFTVKDSLNNGMVVAGAITSKSISEYDLSLNISAKNFMLVNVAKVIGNQVYGVAAADAEIIIKGNSTYPEIEGNLSLNDKSDVTLVLPPSNINKEAAKSVVRFIDRDTFNLPEEMKFSPLNEVKPSFSQFLNYNFNIEVTKKASLTILIDPASGDELKILGDAQLNAGIDPGGNILLAGSYELNSGYYILNFKFLRKKFNLLPGSTIVFAGSPTSAEINIKAEYIANTSARDLIGNEVGTVNPALANIFKQEIPFRVLLSLKGSMLKPIISFEIEMPDEKVQINGDLRTTIENKLAQLKGDDAATNKQVFSLLLFNRFVGEQSTDFFKTSGSGDGGAFNDIARQSVSKFLSAALDNIASDLFKGLDVDLNLNSYKDYSSGDAQQKTDLNVAVSKSFVNDRLNISVGKNFGIEGQDASVKASRAKGTGFLPDVTLNYKLTQDGKYMVRAYKKTQFEVILDGYIIETGLSFIVTMDYDKFSQLFQKKTNSNQ